MALDAGVRAALARSHFRVLPEDILTRLASSSVRVQVPAGTANASIGPLNIWSLTTNCTGTA